MIFHFGKYKNQLIKDIFKKDKQYIKWLCQEKWLKDYHNETYIFCNNLITNYIVKKNDDLFIIYTDGACSNNGGKNPRSGIGVHFSEKNKIKINDVSEKLYGKKSSNNLAELSAILKALQLVKHHTIKLPIHLYTDSSYCHLTITEWYEKWIKYDLLKGKKNVSLIKEIYDIYKTLDIQIFHIKAHTKKQDEHSCGNRVADQLATNSLKY